MFDYAPGLHQGFTCGTQSLDGKLFGITLFTGNGIASGTPQYSTCGVLGLIRIVKCGTSAFNATSYTPATSTTAGSMSLHCTIVETDGSCGDATTFNSTGSVTGAGITVAGTVPFAYGNTSQQLILNPVGETLSASWSSMGCLSGTGTGGTPVTLFNGTTSTMTYTMTSTFRPQITN
jgi:hypothetical protein